MNKMDLRDIQDVELEILKFVSEKCDKNNLRYGLTSGTVLGAIRHGGFIPWDDDIDIVMPRKDYMELLQLSRKENWLVDNIGFRVEYWPECDSSMDECIKSCHTSRFGYWTVV